LSNRQDGQPGFVKKARSFRVSPSGEDRVTVRRKGIPNGLPEGGKCPRPLQGPLPFARRVRGWVLVGWPGSEGSNLGNRPDDDTGALEGARVGLCCRRAHADSDDFGRSGRRPRVPELSRPLTRSSNPSGLRRQRGPRNGASREVLTSARCARPFVWLQKSSSVVMSRQARPVAAGRAHGDSARGTKSAKNGSQRRTGGEKANRVATPGGV